MKLTHLAYRLGHQFKGGVVALASMMGKNDKVLASKLNPNVDTHHLNIEELAMMADFTNTNIDVAQYFAEKANAVVVKLPSIPDASDMGLLDGYMAIMRELGDMSAEFQTAYEDGDISIKEFERIAHRVSLTQAKLSAFQQQVQRVVR